MRSTRYSIIIANRRTGVVRRLTLSLRPLVVAGGGGGGDSDADGAGRVPEGCLATRPRSKPSWPPCAARTTRCAPRPAPSRRRFRRCRRSSTTCRSCRRVPRSGRRWRGCRAPCNRSALGGLSPEAARLALSGPSAGPDAVGVVRSMLRAFEARLETATAASRASRGPGARDTSHLAGARCAHVELRRPQRPVHRGGQHASGPGPRSRGSAIRCTSRPTASSPTPACTPSTATSSPSSHGYGIETRYAHLSRFVVRPGDAVTRGQIVGHAGIDGPIDRHPPALRGVDRRPRRQSAAVISSRETRRSILRRACAGRGSARSGVVSGSCRVASFGSLPYNRKIAVPASGSAIW